MPAEAPAERNGSSNKAPTVYASNLELGTIPPVFVHQLGRSRWVHRHGVVSDHHHDGHPQKTSVHQGRGRVDRAHHDSRSGVTLTWCSFIARFVATTEVVPSVLRFSSSSTGVSLLLLLTGFQLNPATMKSSRALCVGAPHSPRLSPPEAPPRPSLDLFFPLQKPTTLSNKANACGISQLIYSW